MQKLAPLDQHRVVGDLLGERVLEDVLDVAHRGLLVDELGQLQVAEHPVEIVVGLPGDLAYQRERKLLSDHGQRLQQLLLSRGQAVDARREYPLHGGRNLELVERLGEP